MITSSRLMYLSKTRLQAVTVKPSAETTYPMLCLHYPGLELGSIGIRFGLGSALRQCSALRLRLRKETPASPSQGLGAPPTLIHPGWRSHLHRAILIAGHPISPAGPPTALQTAGKRYGGATAGAGDNASAKVSNVALAAMKRGKERQDVTAFSPNQNCS